MVIPPNRPLYEYIVGGVDYAKEGEKDKTVCFTHTWRPCEHKYGWDQKIPVKIFGIVLWEIKGFCCSQCFDFIERPPNDQKERNRNSG